MGDLFDFGSDGDRLASFLFIRWKATGCWVDVNAGDGKRRRSLWPENISVLIGFEMNRYLGLIEEAEKARRKVKDLIDRFPPEKRERMLFDKWSLKDVVAHLNTWMVHDIDCLENLKRGVELYWEPDVDEFNERGVGLRRSNSWVEVYAEFTSLIKKLESLYRELPEELFEVNIWKDHGETVVKFLEGDIKHLESEHIPALEKLVRQ